MEKEHKKIIIGIILASAGLICLLSLVSYNADDIGFYTTAPADPVHNWIGPIGSWLSFGLFICFGQASFIIPILLFAWTAVIFTADLPQRFWFRAGGGLLLVFLVSCYLGLCFGNVGQSGLAGVIIAKQLLNYLGKGGAHIVILTGILLSLFLAAGHYLITAFEKIFQKLKDKKNSLAEFGSKSKQRSTGIKIKSTVRPDKPKVITPGPTESRTSSAVESVKSKLTDLKEKIIKPSEEDTKIKIITTEAKKTTKAASKVITQTDEDKAEYKLPGSDLLDSPPPVEQRQIEEDLQVSAQRLEDTLRDFGIECKADQVERGPVVTRYELLPAPGVKVHRITSLSDDIALAMKAHSVRIVAPIPGKAAVGVEVPNSITSLVFMKDLIESEEFYNTDYVLPIVLGKDISGESIVADLGDMPHMLIAGTTGSGKTVCVNSLITSLLFKFSPDELKFIMVDPKMVELAMYNGLPHLLCPVVTDPKKVSGALAWAVNEMEKRYKLFAKAGVRNIKVYNEQYAKDKFSPLKNVGEPDYQAYESEDREDEFGKNIPSGRLPYIVVMIDELADLMMVASAEIETAIARLAQLSRAVGIHIVLATQRPSVDVITGVIKANFPARISFQVASKVDSRTVLDMNGAEKLLGKGDMLFLQPGKSKPVRAQGVLISDKELNRIVTFIKEQRDAEYNDQVLEHQHKKSGLANGGEKDELFNEAVELILANRQASVSILQRRLRLGYTRAARLIDQMEAEGIVGPYQGSKPREILIDLPNPKG